MKSSGKVIEAMIEYYGKDTRRINHFLKVFSLAKTIGEGENLDSYSQNLLEVAAVVHDIGIKQSEEKYNSSAGKYQEIEGPAQAEKLLSNLGYDSEFTEKVCYIVGHHHTYTNIDTMPYQILVEADFLVNADEENYSKDKIKEFKNKIFKTKAGTTLLDTIYMLK